MQVPGGRNGIHAGQNPPSHGPEEERGKKGLQATPVQTMMATVGTRRRDSWFSERVTSGKRIAALRGKIL